MSTLVLDTITGKSTSTTVTIGSTPVVSSSANSMTIRGEGSNQTSIQQGLCKFWVKWNGTGTAAENDSFNSSGLTDNGTGLTTFGFTTNMGNANYSLTTTNSSVEANNSQTNHHTSATSTIKMETRSGTANDLLTDTSTNFGQICGDLA